MEWRDQGILLGVRRHGETSAILEVFTEGHGRHVGVMRGATSRKIAPVLQPGAQLDLTWRARLDDHIGSYTVEPLRSRSVMAMADRLSLAGLNAVAALLMFLLPEREVHWSLYRRTEALLDILDEVQVWPLAYLKWEMALLEELGFGLDLRKCAVTGSRDDLIYVSPRTGRAVSRQGAGDWADRLLPLPLCMLGQGGASDTEIADGLRTTGYFLMNRLAPELGHKPLPEARQRFMDVFLRRLAQGQHQIDK
ncbi:DNA replication and repair protein RecO [Thalassovita litoralis]|jgi:DNA repair protein RecO (recombination protein O)|uniref:DNA repair protein RecO n=1 Tax=Thalassovita litoralis TaxID=1010611 RepID=A0A521DEU1_9RHOB|nr:DNA repair protein RecO [Thalassovita litoralis]SMO70257.1 DNA replication and repair protein RecO [Thalassovita litoralis]